MAASVVDICNLALAHVGNSKAISNIDAQDVISKVCRRIYDQVRPEVLCAYDWGFARKQVALALLREDPSVEYGFAYAEPGGCLKILRIVSGFMPERPDTVVQFRVMSGVTGPEIWTNCAEAVLEYITDLTDTALFPPDFAAAIGWGMSLQMLPTLPANEKARTTQYLEEKYNRALAKARTRSAGDEQDQDRPLPSSLQARG